MIIKYRPSDGSTAVPYCLAWVPDVSEPQRYPGEDVLDLLTLLDLDIETDVYPKQPLRYEAHIASQQRALGAIAEVNRILAQWREHPKTQGEVWRTTGLMLSANHLPSVAWDTLCGACRQHPQHWPAFIHSVHRSHICIDLTYASRREGEPVRVTALGLIMTVLRLYGVKTFNLSDSDENRVELLGLAAFDHKKQLPTS